MLQKFRRYRLNPVRRAREAIVAAYRDVKAQPWKLAIAAIAGIAALSVFTISVCAIWMMFLLFVLYDWSVYIPDALAGCAACLCLLFFALGFGAWALDFLLVLYFFAMMSVTLRIVAYARDADMGRSHRIS